MLFVVGAAIIAGLLGAFTDWLFMGVLFHDAYKTYPEVWRPGVAAGADKGIIFLSAALGFVMTFAVFGLCDLAAVTGVLQGAGIGVLAWIAGPLPLMAINGLFIKLDGRIIAAHTTGYLVRFVIAGIAAGLAFPIA